MPEPMPPSVKTKEVPQVVATPLALALIERVRAQHGPLMFYQSGGCCDGSAPMCWSEGELLVGDHDRLLGHIGGVPFYISDAQFEYWSHTQLIIDAEPGRGGMFSLESTLGLHFVTRSRLYDEAEWRWLQENGKV
ncbi:DUF779 domain-containing protein [Azohydromonas caseinilytica]|uniref:DUF779 domain-containing protein n=1 Tax=Azohydromonas caseinilytica TaxID=2728836 RepID=A0A848F3X6_9BURK|nr:DUF779 domain-containing protein [Azohydromonas caseinilytica]NML14787.1 DUF779 domain-containing protein [Azohydromonas caseinilytica]